MYRQSLDGVSVTRLRDSLKEGHSVAWLDKAEIHAVKQPLNPVFESFEEAVLQHGSIPSAKFIRNLININHYRLKPYQDLRMSTQGPGREGVACADASFKTMKLMRMKGKLVRVACFTVMSGDGRVLGQWFVRNEKLTSGSELDRAFTGLQHRCATHGYKIRLWYTDNYKAEEAFLKRKIPSLDAKNDGDDDDGGDGAGSGARIKVVTASLAALGYQERGETGLVPTTIKYCRTSDSAMRVMSGLQARIKRDADGHCTVGFDIEYTPANTRKKGAHDFDCVDTIQIACEVNNSGGEQTERAFECVVFHIARFAGRKVPEQLRQFLEDATVRKVGRGIQGDCTRLRDQDGKRSAQDSIDIPVASILDIGVQAEEVGLALNSQPKLDTLVLKVFGHELDKTLQTTQNWAKDFSFSKPKPVQKKKKNKEKKPACTKKARSPVVDQDGCGDTILHDWAHDSIEYAALDAVYSLALHNELEPHVSTCRGGLKAGTKVVMLGPTLECYGVGIVESSAHAHQPRVTVTEAWMPGFKVDGGVKGSAGRRTLQEWMDTGGNDTVRWPKERLKPFIPALHARACTVDLRFHGSDWRNMRIKGDPIHSMFKVFRKGTNRSHPLHGWFCGLWRDAYFGIDAGDVIAIKAKLSERGMTDPEIELMYKRNYCYFLRRCRRHVPEPASLKKRLAAVMLLAKQVDDVEHKVHKGQWVRLWKDGNLNTSKKGDEIWRQLARDIDAGYLSDHPDINYYYIVNDVQFCLRGTSEEEGFHLHMRAGAEGQIMAPLSFVGFAGGRNFRWNTMKDVRDGRRKKYHNVEDDRMARIRRQNQEAVAAHYRQRILEAQRLGKPQSELVALVEEKEAAPVLFADIFDPHDWAETNEHFYILPERGPSAGGGSDDDHDSREDTDEEDLDEEGLDDVQAATADVELRPYMTEGEVGVAALLGAELPSMYFLQKPGRLERQFWQETSQIFTSGGQLNTRSYLHYWEAEVMTGKHRKWEGLRIPGQESQLEEMWQEMLDQRAKDAVQMRVQGAASALTKEHRASMNDEHTIQPAGDSEAAPAKPIPPVQPLAGAESRLLVPTQKAPLVAPAVQLHPHHRAAPMPASKNIRSKTCHVCHHPMTSHGCGRGKVGGIKNHRRQKFVFPPLDSGVSVDVVYQKKLRRACRCLRMDRGRYYFKDEKGEEFDVGQKALELNGQSKYAWLVTTPGYCRWEQLPKESRGPKGVRDVGHNSNQAKSRQQKRKVKPLAGPETPNMANDVRSAHKRQRAKPSSRTKRSRDKLPVTKQLGAQQAAKAAAGTSVLSSSGRLVRATSPNKGPRPGHASTGICQVCMGGSAVFAQAMYAGCTVDVCSESCLLNSYLVLTNNDYGYAMRACSEALSGGALAAAGRGLGTQGKRAKRTGGQVESFKDASRGLETSREISVRDVLGDGHCFYYATMTPEEYGDLAVRMEKMQAARNGIADYVLEHRDVYQRSPGFVSQLHIMTQEDTPAKATAAMLGDTRWKELEAWATAVFTAVTSNNKSLYAAGGDLPRFVFESWAVCQRASLWAGTLQQEVWALVAKKPLLVAEFEPRYGTFHVEENLARRVAIGSSGRERW
jgi:hypothetical protein